MRFEGEDSGRRSETNLANLERSLSSEEAEQAIALATEEVARHLNLRFYHYIKSDTDVVYALDSSDQEVTYGLGKGCLARLGAYGECLEHALYKSLSNNQGKLDFISKSTAISEDYILAKAYSLNGAPESEVFFEFKENCQTRKVLVPTQYVSYHLFDQSPILNDFKTFMSRYVTTSGAAFGLTVDDAHLHALNETIERHLTSQFFYDLVSQGEKIDGADNSYYSLEMNDLPDSINSVVNQHKGLKGIKKHSVLVKQTEFGTWWAISVCHFEGSDIILPQWGAGSSMYLGLAVYRAISESLQMINNYEMENRLSDRKFESFSKQYPSLRRLAFLDSDCVAPNYVKFSDLSGEYPSSRLSPTEQLKLISESMAEKGYRPSHFVAFDGKWAKLVLSYTPNLERFFNITKSMPVLPISHLREERQVEGVA